MIDRKQLMIDRMAKRAQRRFNRSDVVENSRNFMICGPPGAGKTKYAKDNREQFDFVFDYDSLLSAMTLRDRGSDPDRSIELMMALRERYIERSAADSKSRFWLISATADDSRRRNMAVRMGARIIYIATPADVCIERITGDPSRADKLDEWKELVNKWWGGFNPNKNDMVIG